MTGNYEDSAMVAAYALFHYGTAADTLGQLPGPADALEFPQRCVRELLAPDRLPKFRRALDLGCAVGGSTFELSRHVDHAMGVDYSQAFIRTAEQIRSRGELSVELLEMAGQTRQCQLHPPKDAHPERIEFQVGDAMELPEPFGPFEIVLAANLLCRLPDPQRLLDRLPGLIPSDGQLLLTTPFTWLETFTPEKHWIRGAAALTHILDPYFQLDHQIEMPFLIREHARKFQYGIAWGSRWIRH